MLRKRQNKNTLRLNSPQDPIERRLSYVKDILSDSSFFPKSVVYRDIDEEFIKWVEEELKIEFEENTVPTYALFSNQRYSEYMQMWENTDDNYNIKLNFKVVTRENNPKEGTMYDKKGRIPTATKYLMNRIEALNDQGKMCAVEYRMAQPIPVDINYKVTIVTNKYELLNEFSMMVHDKFSSLYSYIFPNGHPMSIKLNNINDESEYNVDDRQYFSQTYDILLRGYIIRDEDFDIEIKPIVSLHCIGGDIQKRIPQVEIEDLEIMNSCPLEKDGRYYNQPIRITINFDRTADDYVEFMIDCDIMIDKIKTENVRTCIVKVNDEIVILDNCSYELKENDKVSVKIKKVSYIKGAAIYIDGYEPNIIYDSKEDNPESLLDFENHDIEIEVE